MLLCFVGTVWYYGHLVEEERADCFAFRCFVTYVLSTIVYSLLLDVSGRLCFVIVSLPGHPPYYSAGLKG